MYTYSVTHESEYGTTVDLFKTEDEILEKSYGPDDVVEDINHLKIIKLFEIEFNPQKNEYLEFELMCGDCPFVDFEKLSY